MWRWFNNYFSNPAEISIIRRVTSLVLCAFLFIFLLIFGIVMVFQLTVFNPDYIASYVDNIDIADAATNWLDQNVVPQRPIAGRAVGLSINYFEPQIKEQLKSAVRNIYTFFLNRMEEGRLLETVVEQRPRIESIASNIQVVLNLPFINNWITALEVPPEAVQKFINVDQINGYLDLIQKLASYQSLLVFVKNIFFPLIAVILIVIIAIVFLARKGRLILMDLGVTLSIYGIIQLLFLIPLGFYKDILITRLDLNPAIINSISRFISDISNLLMIFSAILLFCGLMLIASRYLFLTSRTT